MAFHPLIAERNVGVVRPEAAAPPSGRPTKTSSTAKVVATTTTTTTTSTASSPARRRRPGSRVQKVVERLSDGHDCEEAQVAQVLGMYVCKDGATISCRSNIWRGSASSAGTVVARVGSGWRSPHVSEVVCGGWHRRHVRWLWTGTRSCISTANGANTSQGRITA
jgi:hypothetical protein